MIKLFVIGGSALILVQILAVAVCWRLGAMRGKAVVDWQDCDRKTGSDWDHDDVEAVATIVREVVDEEHAEEDEDAEAADFRLWHAELSGDKAIVKHLRRMERWSR